MAFPQTVLGIKTDLSINNVWTDVSSKVYQRDGMHITRGLQSEGATADVSTCTFTLNNRSGNFSPRNPNGAYYGFIGRNTPVRVSIPKSSSSMNIPFATNPANSGATTPDAAAIDITGDIDVRTDVWSASWTLPTAGFNLAYKYIQSTNQRSWSFTVEPSGFLQFMWSPDGTTVLIAVSTAVVPAPISGRKAVRATLQVNNGSGGYTVTFYTSDTINGTWTQLGDQIITTGGTTSIFNSTSPLIVGTSNTGGRWTYQPAMKIYAAQVRNGINGTIVANPDFTAQTDGATSFADSASLTWTLFGTATMVGRLYKYYGEISEWPPVRDITDRDRTVSITASGILRRLGRGTKPLKSAYYRGCTSTVAPVTALQAYWPCEDATGATSIASGFSGQPSMTISGTPVLATDSTSYVCSDPLPTMGSASFSGNVPGYASTGSIQVKMLVAIPVAGITNGAVLASLRCTGTAVRWEVVYTTVSSGTLTLNAYDNAGTNLLSSAVTFAVTGTAFRLCFSMANSGGNINWSISTLQPGSTTGLALSGTLNTQSVGSATQIAVAPNKDCANATIGHITVQSAVTGLYDLADLLNAYAGEFVSARIARLCSEESINFVYIGAHAEEITMGYQLQKTLLDLLRECELADGGILYESRDFLGLEYRSIKSLMHQNTGATLVYTSADLTEPFSPTEDDRYTINDLVVNREGGSSARYTQTTGTLSNQSPPNGVGTYDASISLNNYLDGDLQNQAAWRVHVGTVDQPRFPTTVINLARSNYTGNATKSTAVQGLNIGDRFVIQSPPSDLPPEDITQIIIGITESLNAFEYIITIVAAPEAPYHVVSWTDGASRYSPDSCVIASPVLVGDTTISVTTNAVLWGFADGAFDIMVNGERMTVTGVTGTSNPQTLSVTRAVNLVAKAHSVNENVQLFDPRYWSV